MKRERVPEFLIEQYVLGELPEETARGIELSPGFAERVAAIERDNAAFLESHPPEVFATRIRNQYEASAGERSSTALGSVRQSRTSSPPLVRALVLAVPGAAAVLALSLVLFGSLGVSNGPTSDPDTEIVRLKGAEPELLVYRSTADAGDPEALDDGSIAMAGDRLQITYNAGGRSYGAIVSIDGRGAVTLHYPLTASSEPVLAPGGNHQLPYAYELDDAPEFERFYFVTADSTFSVTELLASVEEQANSIATRQSRELQLSREYDIATLTIRKGE